VPVALIVGGSGCDPASIYYPALRLLEAGFEVYAFKAPGLEPLEAEPPGDPDIVVYGDCVEGAGWRGRARLTLYSRRPGAEPVIVEGRVVAARDPGALYLAMRELLRIAAREGLLEDTPSGPGPGEVEGLARRLRLNRL